MIRSERRYAIPTASAVAPKAERTTQSAASAASDWSFMQPFKIGQRSCAAGAAVIARGERQDRIYRVHSGWAHRSTVLSDGRRQIFEILLPGDFMGLDWILGGPSSYSVEAITNLTYDVFRFARMEGSFELDSAVALPLLRLAALERQRLDAHMMSLGARSASERVAAFLVDCHDRLAARGLAARDSFPLPLTQQHIADYLGLTLVHVNRMLRRLQERRLITLDYHDATIHDLPGLRLLADADPDYPGTLPV
jgi:CRP-like cAMP-binding protein